MSSAWDLHGQSWRPVAKRVWADIGKDKIFSHAAELAYYFLLALFPLLLFLTSVIGLVIGSGTGLRHSLFNYLGKVLPSSASQLVSDTIFEVSSASGGGKLSFGILAALWAASNGMGSLSQSMYAAYHVEEWRSSWKQSLIAVVLPMAMSALIISALALELYC